MKKVLALLLALTMVFSLAACGEKEETAAETTTVEPITIQLAWCETADEEGHALSKAAYTFKRNLEAASGGQLLVELYPASQLGDAASLLTQVEAGTLESCMSISNGQFATSYYPDLGFLDIPYMFQSGDEATQLLDPDGEFFKSLQADIADKTGIRPLIFFNEGLRHTTNSKHPIQTPEDFKGLKIRTMSVTAHMKMFEALGASATNISWGEVYTALQTNVVDGQENPIANAVYISAWEVQKYMTLDGHVCLCGLFCMNDDFYNSLTAEQQAWVDQAAKDARTAEIKMYTENEAANLQILKDNGMEVLELTAEEKQAFVDACQPQVLEYLRSVMDTPELLDKAMETVEANRK